jgi:hypothetical protein
VTHTQPHHRVHIALSLLTVAIALLAFASASQAKVVVDTFGFPGPEGGHTNEPQGIAINQTGAGGVTPGTLYVTEALEGSAATDANRIQRLDSEGHFERLWGFDVVQGGGTGFEICTVASECKRGITTETAYGGQVHSPGGIVVNQATGNVYVSEGFGQHRIQEFDADGNFIRAWGWDVVVSGGVGDVSSDAFEICTVAADCKSGVTSKSGGAVGFTRIALDPSNHVWTSEPSNHRFQEFEPNGSFIAAYGWDVDALGGSGGLEKCTSTAPGACQAATVGTALGQFGDNGPGSMTIDSSGFIYAVDFGLNDTFTDNIRIQRFDPGMTSASLFAPDFSEETGLSYDSLSRILALPGGHFLFGVHATGGDRLFELDETGQVLETSLAGDGLREVSSLARNEATGTIYATVYNPGSLANPIDGGPGVAVIGDGPATPPGVAIDPVTTFDVEGATFSGSVDPLGKPVGNCRFQYSADQVEWKDVPELGCTSLDIGGGSQSVSESVTGLEPGTHYFVRFAAARYYNNEPAISVEVEFTTPAAPPLLSDVGAAQITDTSAYLAGEVKPRSQSSEYHFEYGTTPALGSLTPTVGLIGSKQVVVSQQLTGLEPNTTYYMRLVAANVAGTTPSPTVTFQTRSTPPPGVEQRAYEQVTPPDKNFSNADFGVDGSAVAADGEAAAFCMTTGFGEPPGQVGSICASYRAARTPGGWRTRWFGEPFCAKDLAADQFQGFVNGEPQGLSANLDFAAILHPEAASCPLPPLDAAAPMPQSNLYRSDYGTDPAGHDLLAPQPGFTLGLGFGFPSAAYEGASEDWSHVIYSSSGQQTPNAPAGDFAKIFDWHEGALSLVSVDPAGNPFTTSSTVPEDAVHGVSADGSRIFLSTTPVGQSAELYMRQTGTKTFDVSQSECTSACGEGAADNFLAATPSGAKAVFMSKAKLLNEDTAPNSNDLYLYTHSTNPPVNKNLTLLSKDSEPADGSDAHVLGLLGIGDDGETAYFAAAGGLVSGTPAEAEPKLYRWRGNGGSPTLEYLATLTQQDTDNWAEAGIGARGDSREVTPEGKYLLIHTFSRLDRAADHDSDADVYRWSEVDGWLCLSCQVPAAPSAGTSTFANTGSSFAGGRNGNHFRNVMSEDGQRVFFTSSDALVPEDTNESRDLYQWHDGAVSLISSGTYAGDVRFLGASKSGDDVFFTTYERLVGWDTDDNSDIYDARVGGGFPEPPPTGAPCEGEACRGAPTIAPPTTGAGTAAFQGPGNVSPKPSKGGKRHKKRHHKKKVRQHKRQRAAKHDRRAAR